MKIHASRAITSPAVAELDLSTVTGGGLGEIVDRVEHRARDAAHRVRYGSSYRQNPRYLDDPEHARDRPQTGGGTPSR